MTTPSGPAMPAAEPDSTEGANGSTKGKKKAKKKKDEEKKK